MPKPITEEGLQRDLGFILNGTGYHQVFASIFPPKQGSMVLEAGCGSGKFGLWYAMMGCDAFLLDIDKEVVEYSVRLKELLTQKVPIKSIIYHVIGSIHTMSDYFKPDTFPFDLRPYGFDFTFNEGLSHHWPRGDARRQTSIAQMVAVTRPGGTVAIMVSNAQSEKMMDYALRTAHTYLGMPPTQEPFEPQELEDALKAAGLQGVQIAPTESSRMEDSRIIVGWGRKP